MEKISKRHKSTGATFVEFAIVCPVILLIVAAVIEFAMTFYQYNLISEGLLSSIRSIVVNTQTTSSANLLSESSPISVQTRVREEMTTRGYVRDSSQITFPSSNIRICKLNNICILKVNANWNIPCLFCYLVAKPSVGISANIPFEDPCFLESNDCINAPTC
jgi:Flp pilus assembly protein TadG